MPVELLVRVRLQLLWMDFAVARGYYERHVLPALVAAAAARRLTPRLLRIAIQRENYHSRLVTYTVRLLCHGQQLPFSVYRYSLPQLRRVVDDDVSGATPVSVFLSTLEQALRKSTNTTPTAAATLQPLISNTTCFDFWQTEAWWRAQLPNGWFDQPMRTNSRRVVHMLNQLTRILRQIYQRDVASALNVLRRLTADQIDLCDRVFVEPINGSLLPSHLSTIFMHNKQQIGLNMKHEANKLFTLSTRHLQSDRDFDPKIYLKMCTSCVGREIFELMVLMRVNVHGQPDTDERSDRIFCRCNSCNDLRNYANAWRYYDCSTDVWVRFEFPRKTYQAVVEILQRETALDSMRLVFTSDKNDFYDKRLFIDNFVNYYVFYENGQHPLVVNQCCGTMRITVSVLYVYAIRNWVMIVDSRNRKNNNSISLNQQSLCKSLGNTVYSIFSENCINRVQCEKSQRLIRENSAYVNRSLGIVPNTGVNAFTVIHQQLYR